MVNSEAQRTRESKLRRKEAGPKVCSRANGDGVRATPPIYRHNAFASTQGTKAEKPWAKQNMTRGPQKGH